ncbi:MAG: molybdate ABC transporter permease subunit [Moraxellaceae bacterium]|nr:MAG: molybdate ABC transporter permease subunit [Moraxellaceae bacterium]
MLDDASITALLLTLKLALLSTSILLVLGTPFAWWLTRTQWRGKSVLEALVALPIVLPPTVLGFYLLVAFGPDGPVGILLSTFGMKTLNFTFTGLVIGSVIYSLPFVVQPLQHAFSQTDNRQLDAAATLGASPWDRFFTIVIPQAKVGYLTACVLGFAHTLGEFGVVLMIGGNIPNETRVVSIAIYDHVESMEYSQAHTLAATLLCVSFVMLLITYVSKQYWGRK